MEHWESRLFRKTSKAWFVFNIEDFISNLMLECIDEATAWVNSNGIKDFTMSHDFFNTLSFCMVSVVVIYKK
jgi:hypothetical protein